MEHARYSGRRYGTLRSELEARLAGGNPVVLEIELQGARQIRESMPDAVQIFIAPPSEDALRNRLVGRGTDDARPGRGAARHRPRGAAGAGRVRRTSWSTTGSRTRPTRSSRRSAPTSPGTCPGRERATRALPPADARLLRGPVPAQALDWVRAATGGAIVRCAPLAGGTSSAVHAVDVAAGDATRALVLRRLVRADWLAEEPDAAAREARVLALLAPTPVPAPRLVAVDPDGAAAGAPAVLMTRLPGTAVWRPRAVEPFLRGLAGVLPAIHAVPVAPGTLPAYAPYALESRTPPSWTRRPAVWERAFARFDAPPPPGPAGLLHRDHHPGNVLWRDGAVVGRRRLGERTRRAARRRRRPLPLEPRAHARAGRGRPVPRPVRGRRVRPLLGRRRRAGRLRRRGPRGEGPRGGGVPRPRGGGVPLP